MRILVIANTNIGQVKIVEPGADVVNKQFATGDAVLKEVSSYLNSGYELQSSSGGVYTLVHDDTKKVSKRGSSLL
jgi:hypothetical protein